MALNSRMTPSSALRPRNGSVEAWAWRPVNMISASTDARSSNSTWVRLDAWIIIAASTPSNRPSSSMTCLPARSSSAGVPRKTISPRRSRATSASAIAAPTPAAEMRLWPQPWPRPRSASYSARMATTGPSLATPEARPDRGLKRAGRMLHRVPGRARVSATRVEGSPFLEARLRVAMDGHGQADDLVAVGSDRVREPSREVGSRRSIHGSVILRRALQGTLNKTKARVR